MGASLLTKAKGEACLEGDRVNAHYMPHFAIRLLRDVSILPMWSCTFVERFGYGRKPASSAASESDFNLIKTHLLRNRKLPIRVDEFVNVHLTHLEGRMKIEESKIEGKIIKCYYNSNMIFNYLQIHQYSKTLPTMKRKHMRCQR